MRGVQAKAKDGSVTTTLTLEARPLIPPELSRLNDLAGNLAYAWDRDIRRVFWRLDHRLWIECENNPKLVLRRVSQRSEEHTSELQSLMRISYADICLKKKK